ncbi:T9SS type A sorting domain-containing protein [Yeosuana sp. MJ-SS3]|uniref:T9SS type A sorting domain-containing protein n=1 Tax=Gilvirhabdus luticola TaxID=3079858 RepID=A0ABU3U5H1_9FLAO|nr:T9SS type A sorting domain-containing protein [Yeosuana sp. MJ-SS3]MDU8885648.1 T9SS type A sorting domain-containing protein [Yeosuana sp. MJ-SS3]
MKKITLLFALLTFSLGYSQTDIALNGSFETGDFTDWTQFPSGTQTVINTNPSDGTFCAELNNNVAQSASLIKNANIGIGTVVPSQDVTITFDARGTLGVGGVAFAEFFSEISGGGTSSAVILGGGPLSINADPNTWTSFSFTTTTGPDVSGGVTFQLTATTSADVGSTAQMFYDNVKITLSAPPAETCMDGIQNQDETGVDCGGVCPACPPIASFSEDFESSPPITGFDGCTATLEAPSGPQAIGNSSTNLAKLVRSGGQPWAGAFVDAPEDFDFTAERYIQLRIWTDAAIGTPIVVKTEQIGDGGNNSGDKTMNTTVTGDWETLTFDFDGVGTTIHRRFVIIPNLGVLGDGTATSTYYFDDIVQTATASSEDFAKAVFKAYPNPTRDSWTIATNTEVISAIEIYDILGKNVMSINPRSNQAVIDGSNLRSGLYFAKVSSDLGTSTLKLVKK